MCTFWRAAFSRNVEVNNNLAVVHFSLWIFGAHINRLNHELAACRDNEVHLCPIILSISASAWIAAGKWTSRLNHRDIHLGIRDSKAVTCESDANKKIAAAKIFTVLGTWESSSIAFYRDSTGTQVQNTEMCRSWVNRFFLWAIVFIREGKAFGGCMCYGISES